MAPNCWPSSARHWRVSSDDGCCLRITRRSPPLLRHPGLDPGSRASSDGLCGSGCRIKSGMTKEMERPESRRLSGPDLEDHPAAALAAAWGEHLRRDRLRSVHTIRAYVATAHRL